MYAKIVQDKEKKPGMAQVNIAHFVNIAADESDNFVLYARDVVAKEVHGLEKPDIQPGSVSVLVIPIDKGSLSGVDSEVQVLVSGNNWPTTSLGRPATAAEAKTHFDKMAERIHRKLAGQSQRSVYVWVTPFTASGWAEGE